MSELSVGKEVLSHCNKCKLALAHIIVTMKSEVKIGRTECKTCGATHAYKDPNPKPAKKTRRKSTPKLSVNEMWVELVSNSLDKAQSYSIKSKFQQGDIIDHPKFGPGIIEKTFDGDKVSVIFKEEIKTLIHNK